MSLVVLIIVMFLVLGLEVIIGPLHEEIYILPWSNIICNKVIKHIVAGYKIHAKGYERMKRNLSIKKIIIKEEFISHFERSLGPLTSKTGKCMVVLK